MCTQIANVQYELIVSLINKLYLFDKHEFNDRNKFIGL